MNQMPIDPRTDVGLPSLGSMQVLTKLSDEIVRVVAPNSSAMTLDGTNTYVFCDLKAGEAVIIDPGPISSVHFERVADVLKTQNVRATGILLTHHHLDHSEAAGSWSEALQVGVSAAMSSLVMGAGAQLSDGDTIKVGNLSLKAVATPGHVGDHLAFQTSDGFLLTGDHILGRSTSVIAFPDGDVEAYLDSLIKVRNLGSMVLLTGHGPEILKELSSQVVQYYVEHRNYRITQIVAFLAEERSTLDQLTAGIYGFNSNDPLFGPAKLSTLAALKYLTDRKLVREDSQGWYTNSKL